MAPVSSSSNFSRQHRAQPSHRLSHSALDISSNVLVFQKNPSWFEGGGERTVIGPDVLWGAATPAVLGAAAARAQAASSDGGAKARLALALPIKIVRSTIGL